jgi:hypothetical protein
LDSGFGLQSIVVTLVPEKAAGGKVSICAFFGVPGDEARVHNAAALTFVTRAT